MSTQPTPTSHRESNEQIVRLVVDYGATSTAVIDRIYGRPSGNAVARLSKDDALGPGTPAQLRVYRGALKKRLSYCQPTAAACRRLGVSEKRADPLGTVALDVQLSLSFFCLMGRFIRLRLAHDQVKEFLQKAAPRPNVLHVLVTEKELGHFTILRAYHAVSDRRRCLAHLDRLVGEILGKPRLQELAASKEYGLAVLVPTPSKLAALKDELTALSAAHGVVVVADLGPTAETLHQCLAHRKGVSS